MLFRSLVFAALCGYFIYPVNAQGIFNWLVTSNHHQEMDIVLPHPANGDNDKSDDQLPVNRSDSHEEPVSDTPQESMPATLRHLSKDLNLDDLARTPRTADYERDQSQELCDSDLTCQETNFCDYHYRKCEPLRQPGQHCRSDRQCVNGFDCMFGTCLPRSPAGHQGARCLSASDCLPDLCCAREHGERVCKPKLKQNQFCYIPNGGLAYSLNELCPCESGLVCGKTVNTQNRNGRELSWLQDWNSARRLRCVSP